MNNIYLKSLGIGLFSTVGAYVLNLLLKYSEDTSLVHWVALFLAFVVGSYIGLRLRANRNKQN